MTVVLVTGAAGFIGSNVARALCARGHQVVGCDRMRTGEKWRNLVDVPLHDLILPDALPAWLVRHAGEVDRIVHLGAVSATTEADVDRIVRDNIRLSLDLWDWAAANGVPLIYASSAATYGNGTQGFEDDEDPAALAHLRPLNAYGWSKHTVDRRFVSDIRAGRPRPPQWAGLKLFNVYGPGEDHKGDMRSVVNKMMPLVRNGQPVKLFRSTSSDYADGGQMRDFVYVGDVVDVIAWFAASPHVSGLFNVGSGQARTWNDLILALCTRLGQPVRIEYVDMPNPLRLHYQNFTEAPLAKLHAAGWNGPITSLEEGVARYIDAVGG